MFYIIQVFVIFTNVASGMFPQLHEYSRTLYLALTSFLLLEFSSSYNFIFYCFYQSCFANIQTYFSYEPFVITFFLLSFLLLPSFPGLPYFPPSVLWSAQLRRQPAIYPPGRTPALHIAWLTNNMDTISPAVSR